MEWTFPQELTKNLAEGRLVLFVGAGLSMPQLPGWTALLEKMLSFTQSEGIALAGMEDSIRELIVEEPLLAAQELRMRMGDENFRIFVTGVFRDPKLVPSAAHRLLPELGFAAVLTTNYDKLIEMAFPSATAWHTQLDYPELASLSRNQDFAIVKVHGDVDRFPSIVLGKADYQDAMFGNEPFQNFLRNTFTTRTVLFVGCSLTDPDVLAFLDELKFRMKGHLGGAHFALLRTLEKGRAQNPLKLANFEKTYGIRILSDQQRDDYPDVVGFLEQLKNAKGKVAPAPAATPNRTVPLPKEEADDIQDLLEAMGQRILDRQGSAGGLHFLSEYKAGPEVRRVVTCYVPQAALSADLEVLEQAIRGKNEEGILLSSQAIAPELSQAARAYGIQAYSRAEFVNKLADFGSYLDKLRADYEKAGIEKLFVPLKMRRETGDGRTQGESTDLDAYIDAWLAAPERNHLSLLGDFGTGKTWFSRRLAWRLANTAGARIPVAIALRDYSRAYDIEQVLTDALSNRFEIKLGAGFKTIRRLNDEGQLLLIFDGFDEMERRASDYRTALDNFREIAKLIAPRSKILLTCRTEFFRFRAEEEQILSPLQTAVKLVRHDDVIDLRDRRKFEVVHVTEFDGGQIRDALQKLAPTDWPALLQKIEKLPKIEDLAHRPVLLGMMAETLPSLAKGEDLNLATLYQHYTDQLLQRRESGSISPQERQEFVEELAWHMQSGNQLSVPFSEFPERVTAHFRLKDDPAQAAFFERDIRTQSYLVRDDGGNYSFAHKSMLEFFVARKLARLLAAGLGSDCPLTDAIVSFVHYLLAKSYPYERRTEGDMVYVPAGAFIYGAESEANLRVADLEKGFWIDRHPVTNEQFCAFLNENGNRKEDGTEWLDTSASKIRKEGKGFSIEPGFEAHPLTRVSWFGASAYAEWSGKRLPTEMEWEKAARGLDGRTYPWGEEFDERRCNTAEAKIKGTSVVGTYAELGESVYGCEDMAGNVWEWTESLWAESDESRVVRGGSWYDGSQVAACVFRYDNGPLVRSDGIGFRCART